MKQIGADLIKYILDKFTLSVFLAVTTTVGFFSLILIIATRVIPEGSREIVYTLVGSVGTAWIGIISFHFGSSSAEANRAQALADKFKNGHSKINIEKEI